MDRSKQLAYCKKCTRQKFDRDQGIICGLTGEKADFEKECVHFDLEKEKILAEYGKVEAKKKRSTSFGFSPKQTDHLPVTDLDRKQMFVVAFEAAKSLNWNIGYLSESGFIAYTKTSMTSWGEEIKVNIDIGEINVKSECTGTQIIDWGRNRRNIDLFFSTFQQKKEEIASMKIDEQYSGLSKDFVSNEGNTKGSPLDEKEKVSGIFSLVLPKGGYFITPVIVLLNVLVFIIMLLSGVHWMMPANESLIQWGANFRPITINGEWWRLITSTFLHIGIFHLLMNMYALVYIGLLLEPYLGKTRFLAAYLITGIVGSVASISWNEMTISAGASGAIFGMYGVFIALLTTRLIDQSARKSLLISIGVFVFYSLANGMKEGIDNAAHLGGLVSGIIIGYAYYPGLIKPDRLLRPLTIGLLALVFSVGSFAVVKNLSSDLGLYESDMQEFVKLEEKALGIYRLPDTFTEEQILEEIQINGIRNWEESLRLIEKTETYKLPEVLRNRNAKLKEYCRLRIKSYEVIYKAIQEQTDRYEDEIMGINMEIQRIIKELSYVPE